jgi:hypothetical protein
LEYKGKPNTKKNKYDEHNGGGSRAGEDYGTEASHHEEANVLQPDIIQA